MVQVFYQSGKLFFQISYKNGVQNGWYEQYHPNGSVFFKEFRFNGETVDGHYFHLYDDGKIYQEGKFKNGYQVGKWVTYDSVGKPYKIYFYKRNGVFKKLKVWRNEKQRWVKSNLY